MKKIVGFKIEFGGGESSCRPGESCDYMLIDTLPDDAPTDELYVEIDPDEIPGEGHYEGEVETVMTYEGDEFHEPEYEEVDNRRWIPDDECASIPTLQKMIAEKAADYGFDVLYCGDGDDIPEEYADAVPAYRNVNFGGILIVSYDADDEEEEA